MANLDDIATNEDMLNIANSIRRFSKTEGKMRIPDMPKILDAVKIPEKTSDLENDGDGTSPFATKKDISTKADLEQDNTFKKDVAIAGNLTVNGKTISQETETLRVRDNIIVTNSDGQTLLKLSGLGIRKDSEDTYAIVYDPASDSVKLGLGKIDAEGNFTFNEGEGQPVAVRDDSSLFVDGHLVKWDATNHKFVDAGDIDKYITTKVDKSATGFSYSDTWSPKTWNGYANIHASNIWTDGTEIYYSSGYSTQYVLDKATSTWNPKTWNGYVPDFNGSTIWSDGENIYISESYGSKQYVLDKSTSTWETKTWNGLTSFSGYNIWTDGENIYCSEASKQYVLDKATSTWNVKTWNGLTSFFGNQVWFDEDKIYFSNGINQYVLDKETSTWNVKTWGGLASFIGRNIWTDGENTYYSGAGVHYVLDRSTSTWNKKTWDGFTDFDAHSIWHEGENIYCSVFSNQFYLSTISVFSYISNSGKSISLSVSDGSTTSKLEVSLDKVTVNDKEVATQDELDKKANKPVDETFTVPQEAWVALNENAPYTFMTSVTATKTIGEDTEVGIINDQPTLFANYGFVVGLLDGQTIEIFSIGQPTASVNLTVRFKE